MRPIPSLFILFLSVSVLHAQNPQELAVAAKGILKKHCGACHIGEGSENGYKFDAQDVDSMIKKHDDDAPVLVPKDPEKSRIWVRAGINKSMPPRSIKERPSEAELETLKKWIEAGAPVALTGRKVEFVSNLEQLRLIREHLQRADPEVRPYLKFFTLTNLHNNPEVSTTDLRVTRAALSKSINSLSRQPRLVIPKAIDKNESIYVIDIRDVGWEKQQLWYEILKHYPYGLDYKGSDDDKLLREQKDLDLLTKSTLVYLRADWFVATATRPPLYYQLLQLPKTVPELRASLKVDRDGNFLADKLWRAGFQASGVSGQNRLVERHDSSVSVYYWESYDFKPRKARANLLRFPLGPKFPGNEYGKQAFDHDGGEMIFGLANGLQAYFLSDGKGNRLDEGPLDVVSDGLKSSGTPAIVNGMSCMHCHKHGMIPFLDSVREGHALFGDEKEKVLKLYPENKTFEELVKTDEERFVTALEKTIGPFLRFDADKDTPTRKLIEPVGETARDYRVNKGAEVTLVKAAAELGIEKPELLAGMIVGNPALKELGVQTLAKGKTVKRDDWEAVDVTSSLFQDVALALRLGTPLRYR